MSDSYPYPFHCSTTIAYDLKKPASVLLEIYNLKGQKVKTLVNEPKAAGRYRTSWDGKDEHGSRTSWLGANASPSSDYFYKPKHQQASNLLISKTAHIDITVLLR